MSNYKEFAELEVDIEEVLRDKEKVRVDDVCLDIGIVKDRIHMRLRRYVCHVLRKNGWEYSSVYNKVTKMSEKTWIYRKKMMDVDYLRGNKDYV